MPPPAPTVWLDLLPAEVCARIATHVTAGRHSPDALSLAEATPSQAAAVLTALSHALAVDHAHSAAYLSRWLAVASPLLTSLHVSDAVSTPVAALSALLSAPRLTRAAVADRAPFVALLARRPALRSLTVFAESFRVRPALLAALARLDLHELHLSCSFADPRHCVRHDLRALPTLCPRLESLAVRCYGHTPPPAQHTAKALAALPTLTHLSMHPAIPAPHLAHLPSLRSVVVTQARNSHLQAVHLGPLATSLSSWDCLTSHDLHLLRACSNLESLRVTVNKGCEQPLAALLQRLPHLRSLAVSWPSFADWACRSGPPTPPFRGRRHYVDLPPLFLPSLVKSLQPLRELSLTEVRLPLSDLSAILISLGKSLHQFGTSIVDQKEMPFFRLEAVLIALATSNHELRRLNVSELTNYYAIKPVPSHTHFNKQQRRLAVAIRRLAIRAPLWQSDEITEFVERAFLHPPK